MASNGRARQSFRPFAPVVKKESASEYFDIRPEDESPYMLIVAPVHEDKCVNAKTEREGVDRVKDVRSTIPAVTNVDYSVRMQTVDTDRSPRLHALLTAFEDHSGGPVLINTSFNIRGEPIVCTAADAYRCFMAPDEWASHLARFGND